MRCYRQSAVSAAAWLSDDAFGYFLLEHQCERSPPWRPVAAKPFEQECGADIVRKVGNDMRASPNELSFIDLQCVAFDDLELEPNS